jgi:hypothetical protein
MGMSTFMSSLAWSLWHHVTPWVRSRAYKNVKVARPAYDPTRMK